MEEKKEHKAEVASEPQVDDDDAEVFEDSNSSTASSELEAPQGLNAEAAEVPHPPETKDEHWEEEKEEIVEPSNNVTSETNNTSPPESYISPNISANVPAADVEQGQKQQQKQQQEEVPTNPPLVHNGKSSKEKEQQQQQANNNEGGRRHGLIFYFCICVLIVVILQGVIIGLVVDRNNDDNNGSRDFQQQTPDTTKPSLSPTSAPPTFSPTRETIFQPLASNPQATYVSTVSTCDDCSERFSLPFNLPWISTNFDGAGLVISDVDVTSNGNVILNCANYGSCGQIDAVSMDLDPSIDGAVYMLWEESTQATARQGPSDTVSSLTISWEDVALFGVAESWPFRVNAQVKISSEEITFCFGEGNTNNQSFRVGLTDYFDASYIRKPPIRGLDSDGYSFTFPNNVCGTMGWQGNDPTTSPSEWWFNPTYPPSWYDNNYPTTPPNYDAGHTLFRPLASNSQATYVSVASTCDDCSESISMLFSLPWIGSSQNGAGLVVSGIDVSSNGYLTLNCFNYGSCGQIDVIAMDLDPRTDGVVYLLWEESWQANARQGPSNRVSSLTISWEDVALFGYSESTPYRVNAQVRISSEEITFCFGQGNTDNQSFRAGITDFVDASNFRKPPIQGLDSDGYSFTFPNNLCGTMQWDDDGWQGSNPTISPSDWWYNPTNPPSWYGNNYPTTPPNYWRPTTAPSWYGWPTSTPTEYNYFSPTSVPTASVPTFFTSIANDPRATPLTTVSNCQNCTEPTRFQSFPYLWKGIYEVWQIDVSSYGTLELFGNCVNGFTGTRSCALINVVAGDLDPSKSTIGTTIWTMETSESYIYSFEQVPFSDNPFSGNSSTSKQDDDSDDDLEYVDDIYWTRDLQQFPVQPNVTAQVHLYFDGRVDICWGSMYLSTLDHTFTSSVVDRTDGLTYPATGPEFDEFGNSFPLRYPFYSCQTILGPYTTPTPSYSLTTQPTWPSWTYIPTYTPTTTPSVMDRYVELELILQAYAPLDPEAFEWLAGVDTWTPPAYIVAPDEMFIERYALVVFYFATSGPSWSNRSRWLSNLPVCNWFGIVCDEIQRVRDIVLEQNQLFGVIPSILVVLRSVRVISLWDSKSGGQFPEALLRMTNLSHLSLRDCGITGTIPRDIRQLQDLEYLNLGENRIIGTVPVDIFRLSNLEYLNIAQNENLEGNLPYEFAELTQLTELYLFDNAMSGPVPSGLSFLYQLEVLNIGQNEFTGHIPTEIYRLTSLRRLHINDCNLTGQLATEIEILFSLEELYLDRNFLTGTIPELPLSLTMCNLTENEFWDTTNRGICLV